MKKHKLLLYEFTSKRMRNKFLLLLLVLLVFILFDAFVINVTGNLWFILWATVPPVCALWVYYAFLIRRAALIVTPNYLILQGPLTAVACGFLPFCLARVVPAWCWWWMIG